MNGKYIRIWKETVVIYLDCLSIYSLSAAEKNKTKSRVSKFGRSVEIRTTYLSQYKFISLYHYINLINGKKIILKYGLSRFQKNTSHINEHYCIIPQFKNREQRTLCIAVFSIFKLSQIQISSDFINCMCILTSFGLRTAKILPAHSQKAGKASKILTLCS